MAGGYVACRMVDTMLASIDTPFAGRLSDWLQVIRGEFSEDPELAVTAEQARQRWPLPPTSLVAILDAFVDVRFLRRLPDGAYARRAGLTDDQ
jgi:hypothetical protein